MIVIKRFLFLALVLFLLAACQNQLQLEPTATPPALGDATAAPLPTTEATTPTLVATAPAADETALPTIEPDAGVPAASGHAFVEDVTVQLLESDPVQVQATITGNLSDGCTTLDEVNVGRQGDTFILTLLTSRPADLLCTQALVPFQETVMLDVSGLAPGTYTVLAGDFTDTFTLPAGSVQPNRPGLGEATIQPGVQGAVPGQTVVINGTGFPANSTVQIGLGPVASEYTIISSVQTDEAGAFTTQIQVPAYAAPMQEWVFVGEIGEAAVISEPFLIVQGKGDTGTPAAPPATPPAATATSTPPGDGVNVPVDGRFTRTQIFMIALEDAGQSGQAIGCNDSVVPVIRDIEPTAAPLTAAIRQLLALDSEFYGESGFYNALFRSDLELQGINIVNGRATIALTGNLVLGGACDAPRVEAQLEQTALQYSTVNEVQVLVNGQPLEQLLSGQ